MAILRFQFHDKWNLISVIDFSTKILSFEEIWGEEEQKERKRESKKRISKGKFRSNSSSIRLCVHACGEENAFNSIQKFKHTLPMFDNGALILIKGLTLKLNIHGAEGVNLFTL